MTEEELGCNDCWRKEVSSFYPLCDFVEDNKCENKLDKDKYSLFLIDNPLIKDELRGKKIQVLDEKDKVLLPNGDKHSMKIKANSFIKVKLDKEE